jgi:hypothetical protein
VPPSLFVGFGDVSGSVMEYVSIIIYCDVALRYCVGALVGFTSLLSRVARSLVNHVILFIYIRVIPSPTTVSTALCS